MKDFEIKIKDVKYPCRVTLRAMLKFKQLTGRDWGQLDGNGVSDMITFLWCCVWAVCQTDGNEFPYELDEFSGHLDSSVFAKWMKYISDSNKGEKSADEDKKKA